MLVTDAFEASVYTVSPHWLVSPNNENVHFSEMNLVSSAGLEPAPSSDLLLRQTCLPFHHEDNFSMLMCFIGEFPTSPLVPSMLVVPGQSLQLRRRRPRTSLSQEFHGSYPSNQ